MLCVRVANMTSKIEEERNKNEFLLWLKKLACCHFTRGRFRKCFPTSLHYTEWYNRRRLHP